MGIVKFIPKDIAVPLFLAEFVEIDDDTLSTGSEGGNEGSEDAYEGEAESNSDEEILEDDSEPDTNSGEEILEDEGETKTNNSEEITEDTHEVTESENPQKTNPIRVPINIPSLDIRSLRFPHFSPTAYCVPLFVVANTEDIYAIMVSVLYQRRLWGISEPAMGLVFEPGDSKICPVIGWSCDAPYNRKDSVSPIRCIFIEKAQLGHRVNFISVMLVTQPSIFLLPMAHSPPLRYSSY